MGKLQNKVVEFRDERDWGKFHNAKDLAISLNIEAGELLENFNGSQVKRQLKQK